METEIINIEKEDEFQVIIGQANFIKTTEDIYEALVSSTPDIKFGVGFNEASGPCLTRGEGNDPLLENIAKMNAFRIGAGHCFVVIFKNAFPINVLNNLKNVYEVTRIYSASSNKTQVVVGITDQGRAILGIVDGEKPKAIEAENHKKERRKYLRDIGYKLDL
ncbi:MAG: adenosine-specific kinase [Candidatus Marsarchaeota archaeon]|nr:adenosine-specific kinase [Candidatus Marsarchaeota archaeon]MCL5094676.1 adenosine-specific kinase [Candidatus Marsarchaeota archaeon]